MTPVSDVSKPYLYDCFVFKEQFLDETEVQLYNSLALEEACVAGVRGGKGRERILARANTTLEVG